MHLFKHPGTAVSMFTIVLFYDYFEKWKYRSMHLLKHPVTAVHMFTIVLFSSLFQFWFSIKNKFLIENIWFLIENMHLLKHPVVLVKWAN